MLAGQPRASTVWWFTGTNKCSIMQSTGWSLAGGHWMWWSSKRLPLLCGYPYLLSGVRLLVCGSTAKMSDYSLFLGARPWFWRAYVTLWSSIYLPAISFWLGPVGHRKDELYPLWCVAAVAFLIDHDDQCLVLFVGLPWINNPTNIKRRRWARGFYQLLAALAVFRSSFIQLAISPFFESRTFGLSNPMSLM